MEINIIHLKGENYSNESANCSSPSSSSSTEGIYIYNTTKTNDTWLEGIYPRMTPAEVALWRNTTKNARHYFEYGIGGSTLLAITELHVPLVTAVDSDVLWINYIIQTLRQNHSNVHAQQVTFLHVNIGPTIQWGNPASKECRHRWPSYPRAIISASDDPPPDVVFVDGRFRVACVFAALLYGDCKASIMIHDFQNRPQYHPVLEFFDVVGSADTLAVLQRKDSVLNEKLIEYQHDFA